MIDTEKFEGIKPYLKYIVLLIVLLIVFLVLRGCKPGANKIEKQMIEAAEKYVEKYNVNVNGTKYIEIAQLGEIDGTEMCRKSSGVIVENQNGKLVYKPYLKCLEYESDVVNNGTKYATLNGSEIMFLNRGEVFNDPGYTLKTKAEVVVLGTVEKTPGIYILKYNIYVDDKLKDTLERIVVVTNSDNTATVSGLINTQEPVITLKGDKEVVLNVGERYHEAGWEAIDYKDGKISRAVKVTPSKVDTSRSGELDINYTVTNSRGITKTVKRHVIVTNVKSNLDISITAATDEIKKEVAITVVIRGSGFSHMLLPNGKVTHNSNEVYKATYNNNFVFKIYDIYGNVFTKEVNINNVDNVLPTGTCSAVVTDVATKVTVDAFDNKGVAAYSYVLDGVQSKFQEENSYDTARVAKKVSVIIKDIVGNENKINCEVTKQESGSLITGACGVSDVKINVATCWKWNTIREGVPLEEYLLGVIYGEGNSTNKEFLKAFTIWLRTYTLRRSGYYSGKTPTVPSCSSYQNWCDVDMGCYRETTQEEFDACIDYAVNSGRASKDDYTANTCATRVTTFPGTKAVSQPTFTVRNPNWPSNMAKSAVASHNTSSWHGPLDPARKALYQEVLSETAGLVIKTTGGEIAEVNYFECDYSVAAHTMCPGKANEMAANGATAEEIIATYGEDIPDRKIECYQKNG